MKYVFLLPLLITLFILDRVFLVLVYWKTCHKFQRWLYKDELILESMHRVSVCLLVLVLIEYYLALW